jgi:hypothetical protein
MIRSLRSLGSAAAALLLAATFAAAPASANPPAGGTIALRQEYGRTLTELVTTLEALQIPASASADAGALRLPALPACCTPGRRRRSGRWRGSASGHRRGPAPAGPARPVADLAFAAAAARRQLEGDAGGVDGHDHGPVAHAGPRLPRSLGSALAANRARGLAAAPSNARRTTSPAS